MRITSYGDFSLRTEHFSGIIRGHFGRLGLALKVVGRHLETHGYSIMGLEDPISCPNSQISGIGSIGLVGGQGDKVSGAKPPLT